MSTNGVNASVHLASPSEGTAAESSGVLAALGRRWPTALALAVSALTFGGAESEETVLGLAEALLILPLLYLITASVQRRGLTWVVFFACIGSLIALRGQDRVEPSVVLLAVALAALLWGTARGQHRSGVFVAQVIGMVAFGALAMVGMAIDPDLSRYVVAASWFAHGVWDLVHLWADKVVARSFAKWCGVVDVLIAAELVLLPLL